MTDAQTDTKTQADFDPVALRGALDDLMGGAVRLWRLCGFSDDGELNVRFSLRKGEIAASTHKEIETVLSVFGASAHARLAIQEVLTRDLAAALTAFRANYMAASGGMAPERWSDADLWITARDGWPNLAHLRGCIQQGPSKGHMMQLGSGAPGAAAFVDALSAHAQLDLSGRTRRYMVAYQGGMTPFEIEAPSPEMAMARLAVLVKQAPSDVSKIHKILPEIPARNAAQRALTRAGFQGSL